MQLSRVEKITLFIVVVYFLSFGLLFVRYHNILVDLGVYLYQGHRIYQGELPYRDFFIPQGPLVLYVYGAVQKLFGPDLNLGRLTALFLTSLSLLLLYRTASRWEGRKSAVLAVVMMVGTLHTLNGLTKVKTFSLTSLVILGAVSALIAAERRGFFIYLASFLAGLACASRITSVLLGPALFCYIGVRHTRVKGRFLVSFLAYLFGASVLFLPSISPGIMDKLFYSLFWVQFLRGNDPAAAGGVWVKINVLSELLAAYYPVLLLAIVLLWGIVRIRKFKDWALEITILAMVGPISLLYLIPAQITWMNYQLDVMLVYLLLISVGTVRILRKYLTPPLRANIYVVLIIVFLLFPLVHIRQLILVPYWRSVRTGGFPLSHLLETSAQLLPKVAPDDKILAFEAYLPLQMDRKLLPNLGAMMCYVPQWSTARCHHFKVVNDQMLVTSIMERVPKLIMLTDADFSMLAHHQSYSHLMTLSKAQKEKLPLINEPLILQHGYQLIGLVPEYGQSKTTLRIYIRS